MEKERFDGQTEALVCVHKVGDERRNHLMHGCFPVRETQQELQAALD